MEYEDDNYNKLEPLFIEFKKYKTFKIGILDKNFLMHLQPTHTYILYHTNAIEFGLYDNIYIVFNGIVYIKKDETINNNIIRKMFKIVGIIRYAHTELYDLDKIIKGILFIEYIDLIKGYRCKNFEPVINKIGF